jgi:hypothetical protein
MFVGNAGEFRKGALRRDGAIGLHKGIGDNREDAGGAEVESHGVREVILEATSNDDAGGKYCGAEGVEAE